MSKLDKVKVKISFLEKFVFFSGVIIITMAGWAATSPDMSFQQRIYIAVMISILGIGGTLSFFRIWSLMNELEDL